MWKKMLTYEGAIYRPPSEAKSLIIQATIGCSWNKCTFCVSYKDKKFRARPLSEVKAEIRRVAGHLGPYVRRVVIADGNALVLCTSKLLELCKELRACFPGLERISCYACPQDALRKSVEELRALREAGLSMVYLGVESGDDEVLRRVRKGVSSEEMVEACRKIKEAGITLSVTVILGLGGVERWVEHAKATADVLSRIDPPYIGALTLMIVPGTPLYEEGVKGVFKPLSPLESLKELRLMVEGLNLSHCIFRCNHASNYLPIGGTLPEDKAELLDYLDYVINKLEKNPKLASQVLRPEYLRAL